MRVPGRSRRSILALAAVLAVSAVSGCSPTSQASPGASGPPEASPGATRTPAPEDTPVPGFEDWQLINPQAVHVSVDSGALVMELIGPALWFNADKGVL